MRTLLGISLVIGAAAMHAATGTPARLPTDAGNASQTDAPSGDDHGGSYGEREEQRAHPGEEALTQGLSKGTQWSTRQ